MTGRLPAPSPERSAPGACLPGETVTATPTGYGLWFVTLTTPDGCRFEGGGLSRLEAESHARLRAARSAVFVTPE